MAREIIGFVDIGNFHKGMAHCIAELGAINIKRGAAGLRDDGKAEGQRHMRDICATNVERPGNRLRVGHNKHVGFAAADLGCDARKLCGGGFTGEAQVMRRNCSV
jgi:hypothetical protein